MARIAKIISIPVDFKPGEKSVTNMLAEHNKTLFPGTGKGRVPIRSASGKYLTGLDPEAAYINKILDPQAKEAEVEKIKERLDRLQKATGLDLTARSIYYSGVYGEKYNTNEVASRVRLVDGENVFHFSDPFQEIAFWWLTQDSDLIAPSLEAAKTRKAHADVLFYISDPDEEVALVYNKKKEANKAIKDLEGMSFDRRRKVARLLGLPITETSKDEMVYNELDKFIKTAHITTGEYIGQDPIRLFNNVAALDNDILAIKDLVRSALRIRVLTKQPRSPLVYEGTQMVAHSEDELVKMLSLDSKQDERLSLEMKVEDKIKMRQTVS